MLVGLNVSSGSCISELIGEKFTSFLHLCFHLSWKHVDFNWLTHTKKLSAAKSDKNIIQEERSIKAAEKDPSVTIVASACLTGPTVVGCVNVTEFGKCKYGLPHFYFCSIAKCILQFHSGWLFALAAKWFIIITVFTTVTFILAFFTDVQYSIGTTSNETSCSMAVW